MEKFPKQFFTYEQQIAHLKSKGLIISNETAAVEILKRYSYYSLVSAYKGVFKPEQNGNYIPGTTFENIVYLYEFDRLLRWVFFHNILIVENRLKSLYSYSFCQLFGDRQQDYCNATNYNYERFQNPVNEFLKILQERLDSPPREYIRYNLEKYGEVPLWVLIHALTLGNLSKMYEFSKQNLQSSVAKEFGCKDIYPPHLVSMLRLLTKFRNTCAHNERFYSYRTKESIWDLPVHSTLGIGHNKRMYRYGKKDLFATVICLRYLLSLKDFNILFSQLATMMDGIQNKLSTQIAYKIQHDMGFPKNWKEIGNYIPTPISESNQNTL